MSRPKNLEKLLKGTPFEVESFYSKTNTILTASGQKIKETDFVTGIIKHFKEEGVDVILEYPCIKEFIIDPTKFRKEMESISNSVQTKKAYDENPFEGDGIVKGQNLRVNFDIRGLTKSEFFLTDVNTDKVIQDIDGRRFVDTLGVSPIVVRTVARPVRIVYAPRKNPPEFFKVGNQKIKNLNTYRKPEWLEWKDENPEAWKSLPRKLPDLAKKFIKHFIPMPDERRFLFTWMWTSLIRRSETCLILCGAPGSGKNRLKIMMNALHGASNSVDGKESSLKTQFNAQFADNTLIWFDEMKFTSKVTERVKEIENDTISIERKGIDATKSTEIHTSLVISNNYPRNNYLVFEDRKFVPLKLSNKNLADTMTADEIDLFTNKLKEGHEHYDVEFVSQIAKYCCLIHSRYESKWPRLEYKGPMFWSLCHTSLSSAKRSLIDLLYEPKRGRSTGWNEKLKMYQWSAVRKILKNESSKEIQDISNASTAEEFLRTFRDKKGEPVFEIVQGKDVVMPKGMKKTMDDFFIKLIKEKFQFEKRSDLSDRLSEAGDFDGGSSLL